MYGDTSNIPVKTSAQIEALKANDSNALRSLYHNNYYKVEKYVLTNSGTYEQAQDVFQEAFIAVWRNIQLDKFQPESNNAIDGYLFRIAKNKWLDYLRSSQFKKVVSIDDHSPNIPQDDHLSKDENEYITAVKKHFAQLGDNCKELLTKFYYDKASMREIAKTYDWTEATARNNKYRCLQRLRELLNK